MKKYLTFALLYGSEKVFNMELERFMFRYGGERG